MSGKRYQACGSYNFILIAFFNFISKSDTTVTKSDFTVDKFASIHPNHYSSMGKVGACYFWDLKVGGSTPAKVLIFSGF